MYQKQSKSILILDDDRAILSSLRILLEAEYERIQCTGNVADARDALRAQPWDLLLMDMNYTPGNIDGSEGLNLLHYLREHYPDLPIIVLTAYSELDLVVQCMQLGASDFIEKPWTNKRLLVTIENVIRHSEQGHQLKKLKATHPQIPENYTEDQLGMIGNSPAIRLVRDKIRKVSATDANVLILGENGTGKELVARAIHHLSPRNSEQFVKIDLGAVHSQLFESELFGAKKGAYTGITEDKTGRMVLADKGTLFLDELGNLELSSQAKLLSALQNREVMKVGGIQAEAIDIRLISATNRTLSDLLDESVFRQDLLYRVNTIEIHLPPLRERQEDLEPLMEHFMELFSRKYKLQSIRFSAAALKAARLYEWPGNIRELQHAVERAVLLCERHTIQAEDLIPVRAAPLKRTVSAETKNLNLEEMEKELIREAIRLNTGNMSKAAHDLGITRAALYRRIEKYGL